MCRRPLRCKIPRRRRRSLHRAAKAAIALALYLHLRAAACGVGTVLHCQDGGTYASMLAICIILSDLQVTMPSESWCIA